ncbi:hypothetical protein ABZ619_38970 [Streptomyces sp. NPDC007851]|uniref:hypothetical protein n=1 Tax=Streptomyces sp. NPDC007851 TaxID=3155008 RepID=UPI0033D61D85
MSDVLNGPPLPTEYAGKAIVWTSWQDRPSCGRTAVVRACKACGAVEFQWLAFGVVGGERRAYGHYCPRCGTLWVFWRVLPLPGEFVSRLDLIVRTTREERIEAAKQRLGTSLQQAIKIQVRQMPRGEVRDSLTYLGYLAMRAHPNQLR